jgi:hypothetical protein
MGRGAGEREAPVDLVGVGLGDIMSCKVLGALVEDLMEKMGSL